MKAPNPYKMTKLIILASKMSGPKKLPTVQCITRTQYRGLPSIITSPPPLVSCLCPSLIQIVNWTAIADLSPSLNSEHSPPLYTSLILALH